MKLFLTATSERGKPITKSGNEYLICEILSEDRRKLITLHITSAKSHLRGEYYNIYLTNHQAEYIDMIGEPKTAREECKHGVELKYPCKICLKR